MLTAHNIDFVEIKGSWQSRFEQAVTKISQLIIEKRKI
jgi:nicotinamide riboside kinase